MEGKFYCVFSYSVNMLQDFRLSAIHGLLKQTSALAAYFNLTGYLNVDTFEWKPAQRPAPPDDIRLIWFGKMLTAVLGSSNLRVQPVPTNMSAQIYDGFHLKKK